MARLALADHAKRDVHVKRERLLETLRSNKQKHIQAYLEAMDGYKEEAFRRLERAVEKARVRLEKSYIEAKAKIESFDPNDPATTIDRLTLVNPEYLDLPLPACYDKAYESAIVSAEWDDREVLELTHAQFECFVRDIWDWTDEFTTVSAMYFRKSV